MVNPRLTEITVSKHEEKYRKSSFPDISKVVNKNPLCTSCNQSVKLNVINGKPCLHPQLQTLLCEKCHSFYGDGEFSVDEDGSDKYCRWCGQGGTIFQCSKCVAGFCKKCIKRNLTRAILDEVDRDDWLCFVCNVEPLWELRSLAWAAVAHSKNIKPPPSSGSKVKQNVNTDKPKSSPHIKKHYKTIAQNLHYIVGEIQSFGKELKKDCDRVNDEKCRPKHIIESMCEDKAVEALSTLLNNSQNQLKEIQTKLDSFCQEWKVSKENLEAKFPKESLTITTDSVSSDEPTQNQNEESSTCPPEEDKAGDEEEEEQVEETKEGGITSVDSAISKTNENEMSESTQEVDNDIVQNNRNEESEVTKPEDIRSKDQQSSPTTQSQNVEGHNENKRKRNSEGEENDNGESDNASIPVTPKKKKLLPSKSPIKEGNKEENGSLDDKEYDDSILMAADKENGENGTMEVPEEVA